MSKTKMRRPVPILFALALATMPVAAMAQESWGPEIYNPAGAEGLLLLPLPCGGNIALKRVVTDLVERDSVIGPLADQQITMGRAVDRSRGFIEFRRQEYLAGSLSDAQTGERFYLIGAYEVTIAQYRAVMDGPENCPPAPQRKDTLPVTDVSWYDAITFTRKLNQWIYAETGNHLAALSQLGVDNGFIRLPTEAEWEFAARGGMAVDDAQRNEPLFFAEGSLNDYAWYNSASSSGGKIKPAGGKKPNPLGLYDMYGNAEEIVLEPFRMTRTGRLHGGIGGFVTRGGSFLDQAETLTSARRDERPFFDAQLNGEFKRRTQSFRVAVSTSSVPADLSRMARLEEAAQEIQRQVPGELDEQPTRQLAQAAEQVQDRALRTEIENLNARLAEEFARRNEMEAANLRATLLNGTIVTREILLSLRAQMRFGDAMETENTTEGREQYRQDIEREKKTMKGFMGAYIASMERINTHSPEVISAQLRKIQFELEQQGQGDIVQFSELLHENTKSYRRDGLAQTIMNRMRRIAGRPR